MSGTPKKIIKIIVLLILLLLPLAVWKGHMAIGDMGGSAKAITSWEYTYEAGGSWTATDNPRNPAGREGREELWLKTVLPEGNWRDPALVVQMYHKFEMLTENGVVYRFGDMSEEGRPRYVGNPSHIIELPESLLGETVYFRVFSDERYIGLLNKAYVDSRADVVLHWLWNDTDQAVIGMFYIFFAMIGGYLYWIYRFQPYFLTFSGFSALLGLNAISRLNVIYLFYDNSLFWKIFELICFYFGETCLIAFLAHFFGEGWKGILKKLWIFHLAYACLTVLLNEAGAVSIPKSLFIYQIILGGSIFIVLLQILYYARTGSREAKIVMAGTIALCSLGSLDLLDSLLFDEWHLPSLHYLGLFYFLLSLVYVLFRRSSLMRERWNNTDKLTAVGQLAAGIAHEIRTPVTVLGGFLSILRKDSPHQDKIDIMKSEVDRINRIVSEFLLLAKPSQPRWGSCRIESILEESRLLFEPAAKVKGVAIDLHHTGQLPEAVWDAGQLKQVFINLLKNALEAMNRPGRIRILAQPGGHDTVSIRFTDEGVGMPPSIIRKIGEPFYTTKEGGTGLGLMICKRIIAEHGGTLHIDSKENEGTTFEIVLPVHPSRTISN